MEDDDLSSITSETRVLLVEENNAESNLKKLSDEQCKQLRERKSLELTLDKMCVHNTNRRKFEELSRKYSDDIVKEIHSNRQIYSKLNTIIQEIHGNIADCKEIEDDLRLIQEKSNEDLQDLQNKIDVVLNSKCSAIESLLDQVNEFEAKKKKSAEEIQSEIAELDKKIETNLKEQEKVIYVMSNLEEIKASDMKIISELRAVSEKMTTRIASNKTNGESTKKNIKSALETYNQLKASCEKEIGDLLETIKKKSDLTQVNGSIEKLDNELLNLVRDKGDLVIEIRKLSEEVKGVNNLTDDLLEEPTLIDKLITEAEENVSLLGDRMNSGFELYQSVKANVEELIEFKASAESNVEKTKNEAAKLTAEIDLARIEFRNISDSRFEMKNQLIKLEAEIAVLRSDSAKARTDCDTLDVSLVAKRAESQENLEKLIAEFNSNIYNCKQTNELEINKIKLLAEEEIQELGTKFEEFTTERKILSEEIEQKMKSTSASTVECDVLTRKIRDIETSEVGPVKQANLSKKRRQVDAMSDSSVEYPNFMDVLKIKRNKPGEKR